jgi:phage terminase Nu1 subunit (DNA packaging protein)
MRKVRGSMGGSPNASKLAALAEALPGQIRAAAQAISLAERRLADVLTLRATGQEVKASALASARMALARTQRDAQDLQRIQDALPVLLKQTRDSTRT